MFFPEGLGAASKASGLRAPVGDYYVDLPRTVGLQRGTEEKAGFSGFPPAFDAQLRLELSRSLAVDQQFYSHPIFLKKKICSPVFFHYHQNTEAKISSKYALYFLPNMISN